MVDYQHLRLALQIQMEPKGQVCRCTMNQAILANKIATKTEKRGAPFTMIVSNNGEEEAALPVGTKTDTLQTEGQGMAQEVWLIPLNSETGIEPKMGNTGGGQKENPVAPCPHPNVSHKRSSARYVRSRCGSCSEVWQEDRQTCRYCKPEVPEPHRNTEEEE